MIDLDACSTCGAARPANRAGIWPWCYSIAYYRSFHNIDQPGPPSRHENLTMNPAPEVTIELREDRADIAALDLGSVPWPSSVRRR